MNADDLAVNNPVGIGGFDFDLGDDLDNLNSSTPYTSGFTDWLFNLSDLDQKQLLESFARYDPESYKALGSPLSGADLAIALGEGREVGETTGKDGFTASQEDQAKALTDSSGRKAVGANLGLSNKGTNPLARLLSGQGGMSDLLGTGLAALMAKKAYDEGEARRRAAAGAKFESRGPVTATRTAFKGTKYSAAGGGIGSLDMAKGGRTLPPRYLDGHSDGMADKIPANIDGKQPAALSDGEFVIPADVVSHLGNGNSNAGAKRLYKMMDDIRAARTGNPKQGKQINPDKFMPR